MKRLAVIGITEAGFQLGEKLNNEFSNITLLSATPKAGWQTPKENLRDLLADSFRNYDGLVCIMATGIVVRMLAPVLENKSSDPAVVVLDEKGQNVISLLSGHLGGGNALTQELARHLNAHPVITTATDVNGYYALDSMARDYNLRISPRENIKIFNKALLDHRPFHFYLEEGLEFPGLSDLFPGCRISEMAQYIPKDSQLAVLITHKEIKAGEFAIFLRPPVLNLGVGCRKEYPSDKMEEGVLHFMKQHSFSLESLYQISSIVIKSEEKAILDFSLKYKIPFHTYQAAHLYSRFHLWPDMHHSPYVLETTGSPGVAEPASLAEEGTFPLVSRKEYSGMTLALSQKKPYRIEEKREVWLRKKG